MGVFTSIFILGCSGDDPSNNPSALQNDWLIPVDEVLDGGPGKDGIPSVDNPKFTNASSITFLRESDLVIGYSFNGIEKAYPHIILDWHEIVNDGIGNQPYAITYCPLTGTAINWSREINGTSTTFGVSGLLYNSNLIPYDRSTDSNWSQMQIQCVNGDLIGQIPNTYSTIETTWETWQEMFPDSQVMNLETEFNRPYGSYPYINSNGDYRETSFLIFPIDNDDDRLPRKERVLGVINEDNAIVFRFDDFSAGRSIASLNYGSQEIVVFGSQQENYLVAYQSGGRVFTAPGSSEGNVVAQDESGNSYNLFGSIIEGPDLGQQLEPTNSFIGYWFSWPAFYSNVEIYNF